MKPRLLYLSSCLPKRSETFVYREVLGLRDLGVGVRVASLYQPEPALGDARADALAGEVVTVYPPGLPVLVRDALSMTLREPVRSLRTLVMAVRDTLLATDLGWRGRLKVPWQCLAGLALAWRVADWGITAVHVHMAHAPATVGMMAAAALGVPFSFTGHAADLFRERGLLREKLSRASFVACISAWHRQWYQSIVPRPEADYPIVRCGVDVPGQPVETPGGPVLHLLCLGRLVPKKGFDVLIAAAEKMVKSGLAVRCLVAGDGPERARLEAQAAAGAAAGCVEFIGSVDHPDVPALLARADVFVMPCRVADDGDRDGIPVVLMEAMARGIPVVSGDLPTIRELVRDGETGCLVPPGDVVRLAGVLSGLAADPDRRRRLGLAGRGHVNEEFSSAVNLGRILAAFNRTSSL